MKFPLSWLKEYISIDLPVDQIAKKLTMAGIEVEKVETIDLGLEGVVVGKVLKAYKHPNAEKLSVAEVTNGTETFQVVCGAPNCREGLVTAFALKGAVLRDGQDAFTIKQTKIRGVESNGMLCSAKELQVGEEADKIMELPSDLKLGTPVASLYNDTIFEVGLTPNLGHCASLLGIARELSASTEAAVKSAKIDLHENSQDPIEKSVKIDVEDIKGCPRYGSRLIKNVSVQPSPAWLQQRLLAAGIRPINNVVDITNYVVLELGQPLHAFDFDRLEGHQIKVRTAHQGEIFVTLDGKERALAEGDLLICDQKRPVALAGIMGGLNSEVHAGTKNVLLEAAYFQPEMIRKTSKRLGLMTDASKRFERGTDPNQIGLALDRAAMLIAELAGGVVSKGIIDRKMGEFLPKHIACRYSRINHVLGTQLSLNEVETIFVRLGFGINYDGKDTFKVLVPTYRHDIKQEIDLIEEVARTYGLDNIKIRENRFQASSMAHSPIFVFEREITNRMRAQGLQEFLTCDLIGPSLLELVGKNEMAQNALVHVLNPTSMEQSILRTSMLPGLLQLVKYNFDHQNHNVRGFEVGKIHFKDKERYIEQSVVGMIMTGKNHPTHWDVKPSDVDFFDLKGIIENLLSELNIPEAEFKFSQFPNFHTGRQASIMVGEVDVGSFGEVHPSIQRRLDVPQRIFFAELNLHDLMKVRRGDQKMEELPIYPASERDWTITLPEKLPIEKVLAFIAGIKSELLESVSLVDLYRSDKLGKDLKNATFHFVYRDRQKTIGQEAVDQIHEKIVSEVQKKVNV